MVQLNPPVCDTSDDYLLCLTVVKEIQELRFQMIYSEEQQNRLDRKIEELKSWITNDLRASEDKGFFETYTGLNYSEPMWNKVSRLADLKSQIDELRIKIDTNKEFKKDLKYKDVIAILTNDNVAQKVIADIKPGKVVTLADIAASISVDKKYTPLTNSFGRTRGAKLIKSTKMTKTKPKDSELVEGDVTEASLTMNPAAVEKAIANAIVESVLDETRDAKLVNKQYDLDLENLDNTLETLKVGYKNQLNSIKNQQEVFRHLQQRNISKISREVKKDYARWKKVLTPETLGGLIEFSNLNSQYLTELNELESNNPTESNLSKLVTMMSRDSTINIDEFRKREIEATKKEIDLLVDRKNEWSLYYDALKRIISYMFSPKEETVRTALFEISSELPGLKPTIFLEDAKIRSKRQKDVDRLKVLMVEAKEALDSNKITQEQYDSFIKESRDQIIGVGQDIDDLDVFERISKTSTKDLRVKESELGLATDKQELFEIEKQALTEEVAKQKKIVKGLKTDINSGSLVDRMVRVEILNKYLNKQELDINEKEKIRITPEIEDQRKTLRILTGKVKKLNKKNMEEYSRITVPGTEGVENPTTKAGIDALVQSGIASVGGKINKYVSNLQFNFGKTVTKTRSKKKNSNNLKIRRSKKRNGVHKVKKTKKGSRTRKSRRKRRSRRKA